MSDAHEAIFICTTSNDSYVPGARNAIFICTTITTKCLVYLKICL